MKTKIVMAVLASLSVIPSLAHAGPEPVIELEYTFTEPILERIDEYYSVRMPDTRRLYDAVGLPLVPVKTAKILIPQGRDVKAINIVPGKKVTLDGQFKIEYGRPQVPMGSNITAEAKPNREVYDSLEPFPGGLHSVVSTQFLCGYKILLVNLHPVEYIPASGKVSYYERMKVIVAHVSFVPAGIQRAKCRGLPEDTARVRRLVDNPAETDTYTVEVTALEDPYEHVIITNSDMADAFQVLSDWKTLERGVPSCVVTTEYIMDNYAGYDVQEQIRNFIAYAYDYWGTRYVVLGGDADTPRGKRWGPVIPPRGVYGEVTGAAADNALGTYIDENIPCDMYYGALDGDWDNDGDGIYGEGDSSDGGTGTAGDEADFIAEVLVGRIPADDATEALNQINKIIAYESSLHTTSVLLVGRQADQITWGGDYKDEVYSYFPTSWSPTTLYDRDGTYSTTALISEMNSDAHHIVNYCSHSSYTNDMGLSNAQIAGLTNTKYFLAYSQGCMAGGFDSGTHPGDDCAGEHFTVENGNGGAFAYIGNTRYGWYTPGSIEGLSQLFDEQIFDAIFSESIENEDMMKIGGALQDSKEDNLGLVQAKGAIRWCYFELCLLGDPETPVSEEPPVPPDTTPPVAVADLVTANPATTSIELIWTAPGDDASSGTASQYDIRYSTSGQIDTDEKWSAAAQCTGEPSPLPAGTTENFAVTGLAPNTTYWFALKTADEVPNWSGLSNSPSATTTQAGPQAMHVSAIVMSLKSAGPNVNAVATVTIVDALEAPVAGATVYGYWSQATSDTVSGTTNGDGQVALKSDRVRNPVPDTTFTFTVDDLVLTGWVYNPSANTENSDSITTP